MRTEPVLMTIGEQTQGYKVVYLYRGGRQCCKLVHNLVLEAFVGPRPGPKIQGAHLDGKKAHNWVENLAWCTAKVNASHRVLHGTNGERQFQIVGDEKRYQCTNCHTWLTEDGFYAQSGHSVCKLASWCKHCSNHDRSARRKRQRVHDLIEPKILAPESKLAADTKALPFDVP